MPKVANVNLIKEWNTHINANPDGGNILQGKEFMEQKVEAGWTALYLMVSGRAVAIMEKKLPLLGKVWYAPKGPSTTSYDDLKSLLDELVPYAKKNGVFTLKIEPELPADTDMSGLNLEKTKPIQYNYSTVYVDLTPSLDDIMTGLPQKGRHAIRRAERDGVTVELVESSDKNCRIMYNLLRETADGAGFAIRPADYYRRFYHHYGDNGQLFFAYFNGQVVAGAFAMVQGRKSMYKDGASIRERTAYGASHLLQWQVIAWAKAKGSLSHDLAGAPPVALAHDTTHPFHNMGRFKRQFNKQITEYVGTYNIAVRPLRGTFWNVFFEKVVRRLYFKYRHQSWY